MPKSVVPLYNDRKKPKKPDADPAYTLDHIKQGGEFLTLIDIGETNVFKWNYLKQKHRFLNDAKFVRFLLEVLEERTSCKCQIKFHDDPSKSSAIIVNKTPTTKGKVPQRKTYAILIKKNGKIDNGNELNGKKPIHKQGKSFAIVNGSVTIKTPTIEKLPDHSKDLNTHESQAVTPIVAKIDSNNGKIDQKSPESETSISDSLSKEPSEPLVITCAKATLNRTDILPATDLTIENVQKIDVNSSTLLENVIKTNASPKKDSNESNLDKNEQMVDAKVERNISPLPSTNEVSEKVISKIVSLKKTNSLEKTPKAKRKLDVVECAKTPKKIRTINRRKVPEIEVLKNPQFESLIDALTPSADATKYRLKMCFNCNNRHMVGMCYLQKPLLVINDPVTLSTVSDNADKSYADASLPECCYLKTVDDQHGPSVFVKRNLPKFTQFGPLVACDIKCINIADDCNMRYIWEVSYKKFHVYKTSENASESNWFRYVRPAESHLKRNLTAITKDDQQLYLVTTKDVGADEELCYWLFETNEKTLHKRNSDKTNCGGCSVTFNHPIYYRLHCSVFHDSRFSLTIRKYHCKVCEEPVLGKENMEKHASQMHNGKGAYQCQFCQRIHRTYGCAANPHRTQPLCDFCGRKFCQPQKLKCHIKRMHKDEPLNEFKCNVCSKLLASRNAVQRHAREVHRFNDIKIMVASKISKEIKSDDTVKAEILKEVAPSTITCNKCLKIFQNKSNLKIHMLTHSGVKPFKCNQSSCSAAFTTKQCLQQHYKKTHGFSDEAVPKIIRSVEFTFEAYCGKDDKDNLNSEKENIIETINTNDGSSDSTKPPENTPASGITNSVHPSVSLSTAVATKASKKYLYSDDVYNFQEEDYGFAKTTIFKTNIARNTCSVNKKEPDDVTASERELDDLAESSEIMSSTTDDNQDASDNHLYDFSINNHVKVVSDSKTEDLIDEKVDCYPKIDSFDDDKDTEHIRELHLNDSHSTCDDTPPEPHESARSETTEEKPTELDHHIDIDPNEPNEHHSHVTEKSTELLDDTHEFNASSIKDAYYIMDRAKWPPFNPDQMHFGSDYAQHLNVNHKPYLNRQFQYFNAAPLTNLSYDNRQHLFDEPFNYNEKQLDLSGMSTINTYFNNKQARLNGDFLLFGKKSFDLPNDKRAEFDSDFGKLRMHDDASVYDNENHSEKNKLDLSNKEYFSNLDTLHEPSSENNDKNFREEHNEHNEQNHHDDSSTVTLDIDRESPRSLSDEKIAINTVNQSRFSKYPLFRLSAQPDSRRHDASSTNLLVDAALETENDLQINSESSCHDNLAVNGFYQTIQSDGCYTLHGSRDLVDKDAARNPLMSPGATNPATDHISVTDENHLEFLEANNFNNRYNLARTPPLSSNTSPQRYEFESSANASIVDGDHTDHNDHNPHTISSERLSNENSNEGVVAENLTIREKDMNLSYYKNHYGSMIDVVTDENATLRNENIDLRVNPELRPSSADLRFSSIDLRLNTNDFRLNNHDLRMSNTEFRLNNLDHFNSSDLRGTDSDFYGLNEELRAKYDSMRGKFSEIPSSSRNSDYGGSATGIIDVTSSSERHDVNITDYADIEHSELKMPDDSSSALRGKMYENMSNPDVDVVLRAKGYENASSIEVETLRSLKYDLDAKYEDFRKSYEDELRSGKSLFDNNIDSELKSKSYGLLENDLRCVKGYESLLDTDFRPDRFEPLLINPSELQGLDMSARSFHSFHGTTAAVNRFHHLFSTESSDRETIPPFAPPPTPSDVLRVVSLDLTSPSRLHNLHNATTMQNTRLLEHNLTTNRLLSEHNRLSLDQRILSGSDHNLSVTLFGPSASSSSENRLLSDHSTTRLLSTEQISEPRLTSSPDAHRLLSDTAARLTNRSFSGYPLSPTPTYHPAARSHLSSPTHSSSYHFSGYY